MPNYLSQDTIFALASPTGGAICVLRVSGSQSLGLIQKLVQSSADLKPKHREAFRVHLKEGQGKTLDDAVGIFFQGPQSFTGEDVLELYLHGSFAVAESVLSELTRLGARQALPGEFSFRAVRNGKMDLAQAQAVSDLITARNREAADLALEKMGGSQSHLIHSISEELRTLASLGELAIDFSDQDVDEVSLPRLKRRLGDLIIQIKELEGSFDRGRKIQEGVRVAFIGKPNVGKSSFFNALLGEERSIVSEQAGTTRDLVRETLTLSGSRGKITLRVEDTAGLRHETSDQIEKIGMERTFKAAKEADFVLWIVDGRSVEEGVAQAFLAKLPTLKERVIGILNKSDLIGDAEREQALSLLKKQGLLGVFSVSSKTGKGIQDAATGIALLCEKWVTRSPGEVLLTRMDHLHSVQQTLTHLDRALGADAEDLFAADLRQALLSLGEVIGTTLPDDILGRIFSQFCIGK